LFLLFVKRVNKIVDHVKQASGMEDIQRLGDLDISGE
jgi:hypothetical protein